MGGLPEPIDEPAETGKREELLPLVDRSSVKGLGQSLDHCVPCPGEESAGAHGAWFCQEMGLCLTGKKE